MSMPWQVYAVGAVAYLIAFIFSLIWRSLRGRAETFRVRYLGTQSGQHCVQVQSKKGERWLCRGVDREWTNADTGKPLPCWVTRVVYRFMLRRDRDLRETSLDVSLQ